MKQILILCLLLSWITLAAQQPAQYSLFMMNNLNWNPAYAGLDNALSITGVYRSQWQGISGNPVGQNVSIHAPLYVLRGGIGANLENDELGAERRTNATLMYNYQLPIGRRGILSLGANVGLAQRTIDGTKLRTPEGTYINDQTIIHNDDLLPVVPLTARVPTFGAGAYFYTERFGAGIATRHLSEPYVDLDASLSIRLRRAYFLTMEGRFDLGNGVAFKPSLMVQADQSQVQANLAAIFQYNSNILLGASLRGYSNNSLDAAAVIVGFNLSESISLAYAYDFTLSELNQVSNGSHEVMINYRLNKSLGNGRLPKIIYNPRAL